MSLNFFKLIILLLLSPIFLFAQEKKKSSSITIQDAEYFISKYVQQYRISTSEHPEIKFSSEGKDLYIKYTLTNDYLGTKWMKFKISDIIEVNVIQPNEEKSFYRISLVLKEPVVEKWEMVELAGGKEVDNTLNIVEIGVHVDGQKDNIPNRLKNAFTFLINKIGGKIQEDKF